MDILKRIPLVIAFDTSFEQKVGPFYSLNGPTLEFEVVGDRTNFFDLQNIYLEVKCKVLQLDNNILRFTTGNAAQNDLHVVVNNTLHWLNSDWSASASNINLN